MREYYHAPIGGSVTGYTTERTSRDIHKSVVHDPERHSAAIIDAVRKVLLDHPVARGEQYPATSGTARARSSHRFRREWQTG